MSRSLLIRLAFAGVAFLLSSALASLVGAERFGEIALSLFIAKIAPLLSGGAHYGYIKSTLDGVGSRPSPFRFYGLYALNLLTSALILTLIVDKSLLPVTIALVLVVALEPIEKVQERLHFIYVPDLVYLSVALAIFLLSRKLEILHLAVATFSISALVVCFSFFRIFKSGSETKADLGFNQYLNFAKQGLPLQVSGLMITGMLLTDRFFLSHYWEAHLLGIVLYSYQVAQGATLPLQSLNQLFLVQFSRYFKAFGNSATALSGFLRQNKAFIFIAALAPVLAVLFCIWFSVKFEQYEQLPVYAVAYLSVSVIWAICGTQIPAIFFGNRSKILYKPAIYIFSLNAVWNLLVINFTLDFWLVPLFQSFLLLALLWQLKKSAADTYVGGILYNNREE